VTSRPGARPQRRSAAGRGPLTAALATAGSWLLEPAEPQPEPEPPVATGSRPVVSVFGLAPRCGATTISRALGAELAIRSGDGACAVSGSGPAGAIPLGTPAAARLARALAELAPGRPRASGRLCLIEADDPLELADLARGLAPLVLDAGRAPGGAHASVADRVLLVAGPGVEPSLAVAVAATVSRVASRPLVVLNRPRRADGSPDRWEEAADLVLPDSRTAAQLALGGREPRGSFGRAVGELADLCEVLA
jgi:hypothetical protein